MKPKTGLQMARQVLQSESYNPYPSMPTYDYECETCGKRFEVFQSMKDAKLETCPAHLCQDKGKVRRLLGTGGGIIFKGGGFYQTDYRSASYESGAKKDSESKSPPSAGDSKPSNSPTTPS
jgi:putative FmdB family regulatory protein